jgi:hypothetical protein
MSFQPHENLGFAEPLTELSVRDKSVFLESRARSAHEAVNLTAICEPIVKAMWDLQQPTTHNPQPTTHNPQPIASLLLFFLFGLRKTLIL